MGTPTPLEQAAFDAAIAYAKARIRLNEWNIRRGSDFLNRTELRDYFAAKEETLAVFRLLDLAVENAAQDNVTTELVRTNEHDVRNDPPQMDWNGEA